MINLQAKGMPRITENHQKLGRGKYISPPIVQGAQLFHNLYFRLSASRTVRQYIFIVLSHPVGGTLLQQPWEVNSL